MESDLLGGWEKLPHYLDEHVPSLADPRLLQALTELVRENPDTYTIVHCGIGPFERMRSLRGAENLALDLHLDRNNLTRLGDAVFDYFRRLIHLVGQSGADAFVLSDDFGVQRSLFMSPAHWREAFKPGFRTLVAEVHRQGMSAWLHSCGNVTEIVPDLIEIGLDVLHPIQPGAMDQAEIADRYKGRITFWGGIDVQNTLPYGTEDEVREHVRRLIDTFDQPAGGFLLSPSNLITPETTLANIRALYWAAQEYACGSRH